MSAKDMDKRSVSCFLIHGVLLSQDVISSKRFHSVISIVCVTVHFISTSTKRSCTH